MKHSQRNKKNWAKSKQISEITLYIRMLIFGLCIFSLGYWYSSWLGIPNLINKVIADTAIIFIGLSMLLSSLCYFWNFVDPLIIYRKYLGLLGWAYAIVHILLSTTAFLKLFNPLEWQKGAVWPAFYGLLAVIIFTVMTLISNRFSAQILGSTVWRGILRVGYLGVFFVFLHVYLLKSGRWIGWFEGGMQTPPSLSLLVTVFMVVVVLLRVLLWSLLRKQVGYAQTRR